MVGQKKSPTRSTKSAFHACPHIVMVGHCNGWPEKVTYKVYKLAFERPHIVIVGWKKSPTRSTNQHLSVLTL